MSLPRVWLVPYLPGWSYDLTAQALVRHLSHRFEMRVCHQGNLDQLFDWEADIIVDFWWKGTIRRNHRVVLKQVSSHRWEADRYGAMHALSLTNRHLVHHAGIAVPSKRLLDRLATVQNPKKPRAHLCPKGFHPEQLGDYGMRRGELTVGWAGAADAVDKRVDIIRRAAPAARIADRCLTQGEMADFYNGLDVITVASDAEGDPRPLIEGMACGCFPVVTDVGIVPELVQHGVNGLIVEQSAQAFADAFAWCQANIEQVRAAGARNAQKMLATRTWKQVAEQWGDAIDAALAEPQKEPWPAEQVRSRKRSLPPSMRPVSPRSRPVRRVVDQRVPRSTSSLADGSRPTSSERARSDSTTASHDASST